jgi:hypothetical protein
VTTRTRRHEVSFRHPFTIRGVDGEQPAGAYTVETDEELLEQLSFPVWHRVATTLILPSGANSYAMFRIDPAELQAAEKRDAEAAAAG